MNYALLISGGVDSAVATHLLCEKGIRPDLFYIKIGMQGEDTTCTAEEDMELSQSIARKYGLHLEVVDLQEEYHKQVVGYMLDRAVRGLTPNSDVMCNRLIKFGAFEQVAGHAYDRIVTGHYARMLRGEHTFLGTAADPVKDQTDFLAQLLPAQLLKLEFPLGDLLKEEVRQIARDARLASARRKDSQGICFLGKINFAEFMRKQLGERPGDVVDIATGRVIGQHRGYWFHTIGQRKGLGLGGGPWFVVRKDIERNIIYVAGGPDATMQYGREIRLSDFSILTENPWPRTIQSVPVTFKVRHTDPFRAGTYYPPQSADEGGGRIVSENPVQGIAPGQFCVIYDVAHRICVGSGEIASGNVQTIAP